MSEQPSAPKSVPPPGEPSPESEMAALRKEVIEARNLVIKTDNLLKNLHAELKQMGRKHDEQERRHWMTSVTAYIIFALLVGIGAIAYARAEVRTAREEAQALDARAHSIAQEAEKSKADLAARKDASERALRVYDLLGSEKEGPGLGQAMTQAMHLPPQVSQLEARAIEDRSAGLKAKMAEQSLERGQQAFRRQDWKAVSAELGRYVELTPRADDPMVYFHLGSARFQLKDFPGAIAPLETFVKSTGNTKTNQYAGLLLGQSYEETNNAAKAKEVYDHALSLYPGSEFAPAIRNRLRKMGQPSGPGQAPAPAPQQPAPTPAPH